MLKVILLKPENVIKLSEIKDDVPIFVKKNKKIKGMVIKEPGLGWQIKVGGTLGVYNHHETRRECIEVGEKNGYEFFVEE